MKPHGLPRPLLCAVLLVSLALPALAQPLPVRPAANPQFQVYAYTLKHQQADEALALIRSLLSSEGTVEVQPGGNTLVIRDYHANVERVAPVLESFDHPPQDLRFDIRILRAGPRRAVVSPPIDGTAGLPEELVERLRRHLRYEDYEELANAAMTSREGEDVTYSLGRSYSVSFRSGAVMTGAKGQRLKLEGFRIHKHVENPTNKGRRLEPEELFHANLYLWIDQPFSLVLTQDESRQEALLIAIFCRQESDEPVSQQ